MSYCPVLDSNQYHSYPKGILTTWTTGTYGAKGGTWTRMSFHSPDPKSGAAAISPLSHIKLP